MMGQIVRRFRNRLAQRPPHALTTFWEGFWQGLAAPTMVYEPPSRHSPYDGANAMIRGAWSQVGQSINGAMGDLDKQVGGDRG